VIAAKGVNDFLGPSGNGGIHCGVRKDFVPTLDGLKRKGGKKVSAPVRARDTNNNYNYHFIAVV
jgi:hypothetical protein